MHVDHLVASQDWKKIVQEMISEFMAYKERAAIECFISCHINKIKKSEYTTPYKIKQKYYFYHRNLYHTFTKDSKKCFFLKKKKKSSLVLTELSAIISVLMSYFCLSNMGATTLIVVIKLVD